MTVNRGFCRGLGPSERGEEQTCQHRDDRYDSQKLDERESRPQRNRRSAVAIHREDIVSAPHFTVSQAVLQAGSLVPI